jgi:hypothetical protein
VGYGKLFDLVEVEETVRGLKSPHSPRTYRDP